MHIDDLEIRPTASTAHPMRTTERIYYAAESFWLDEDNHLTLELRSVEDNRPPVGFSGSETGLLSPVVVSQLDSTGSGLTHLKIPLHLDCLFAGEDAVEQHFTYHSFREVYVELAVFDSAFPY